MEVGIIKGISYNIDSAYEGRYRGSWSLSLAAKFLAYNSPRHIRTIP